MEQPPLSQSIQRLEKSLGTTLFDRSNRQTRLTEAGAILLDEARKSVQQFDRALAVVRQSEHANPVPIRIGFVTAGILRLLPLAIRNHRSERLNPGFHLVEASTTELLASVADGGLDLALVHPTQPYPRGLVLEELQRDRIVAALPKAHALARRRPLLMQDLAQEPLIFFPKSANPELHERFVAFFQARGIVPLIEQEVRLTPTILSLVAAGLGYALIQEGARHLQIPDIVFRPVLDLPADLVWTLAVAWKPNAASPAIKSFVGGLRQIARA